MLSAEERLQNEFGRINLTCDGASVVPRGPGYFDGLGANQVCILFGSTPGSNIVPGRDYIRVGYEYNVSEVWRNFGCVNCVRHDTLLIRAPSILVAFFIACVAAPHVFAA
jgi:hypothetical protein